MSVLRITPNGSQQAGESLQPLLAALRGQRASLAQVPINRLLALCDDFSRRLLRDDRTRGLEGIAFLSAWLGSRNLQQFLEFNLNGDLRYLDGFVLCGNRYLAARPQGLVAMWLPGNVPTLPIFALVPTLLAKNVCLVKVASADAPGLDRLLAVLEESEAGGLCGRDLLATTAVVWFDYHDRRLNEEMSLAADAKVIWGGEAAVRAIIALPRQEHCVEIVFGPKYSIGVISRGRAQAAEGLDILIADFVRDVAAFEQRTCSSPQTIFLERNQRYPLQQVGQMFAQCLARLPQKLALDAYTTVQILNARAQWALDDSREVIASTDGANWTVCMDRQVSLKEAVQSRTVFLTEVQSWQEVIGLLSPRVQTVGMAFADPAEAIAFAEAATGAGVARCVRPGLMNNYESPWDGKLLVSQLVRWVTLKP